MTDEELKVQIGTNISNLRKRQGLTQAGLAEKLNYSDKAVSKWERGESAPDVLTLAAIAQVLGVTVDDLLSDPNALPETTAKDFFDKDYLNRHYAMLAERTHYYTPAEDAAYRKMAETRMHALFGFRFGKSSRNPALRLVKWFGR